MWLACKQIAQKACEAGAVLVFAGDFNAITSPSHRRGASTLKTPDRQFRQAIQDMHGVLAHKDDDKFS